MASKIVPQKAFVLGATGTTGKAIIKAIVENAGAFEKVTLIGRRKVELPPESENPVYSKFDQKIVNFEDPSTYQETFKDYDVGFCALGTSSVGLTEEQYFRVTHDYVVDTAKLAKEGGCKHYHLVSGRRAASDSWFHWARTKFTMEQKLTELGFDRLSIYRPAGIIKDSSQVTTTSEKVGICAFKILDPFKHNSVESVVLGKTIVENTFVNSESKVEILENADIHKLAKAIEKNQTTK